MAIVQISKIQVRSGSLVDLPQLDEAEFGWASDDKRLFIGKTTPNENVEVLTSYSQLNFSQIVGSYGNLDIANTVADGEILTFDGANWVNRGGSAGGLISLGNISNVQIDGGAIGYIMETDGAGNLAWTPKGTLYSAITNFHPTTFTGSIAEATVTAGSFVIGQTYQIKTVGTTNFVTIGASANTIDVVFTATGVGTGDGTAYLTTLTVTAVSSGYIGVNSAIQTSVMTITSGTYVVSQITGTVGLVGTYYLNKHHTLSSTTIYGPLLMQVANTVPYTNGTEISISGVQGVSNATVNGLTFYLSITANYASSGNVALYTDFARVLPTNGTTVTYTNAPNAIATAQIGSGSGGAGAIGGSNGMVQFNSSGIFNGDSGFTFNLTAPKTLTVDGNFNISNVVASNTISATQFISNIAIGTPPLIITSTTLVPNLYVARANVSDNDVVTTQTTGTFFPTFVSSSGTGNLAMGSNANLSFNAATGNLSTTLLKVTSSANVGNLGTAGLIIATGNITGGNLITAGFANIASNANIGTTLSVVGNANVGNLGTTTAIITTGNITTINSGLLQSGTSNITLTANGNVSTSVAGNANILVATGTGVNVAGTLNVTGNANVNNLGTATAIITTGNITTINSGLLQNGNSNITLTANSDVTIYVAGNANARLTATSTGIVANGTLSVSGNISAPFFIGNVQGNISGTLVVPGSNTAVIFNYTGNANASDAFKFNYAANVLTVIGNIVSSGAGNVFSGNGSALTALNASNVSSGTLAQARLANASVTLGNTALTLGDTVTTVAGLTSVTSASFVGELTGNASGSAATVTTNAQPNITSTGNLNSATVINNSTGYNIQLPGVVGSATTYSRLKSLSSRGTLAAPTQIQSGDIVLIIAAESYTGSAFTGTGTIQITTTDIITSANRGSKIEFIGIRAGAAIGYTASWDGATLQVDGNVAANGVFSGNGSSLTALNASNVSSGTLAQVRLANASVTLGSTALTLGSTVTTVAGLTSVTSTTFVGSLTGAATTAGSATTAGTVTTAAQPKITSVGTLTTLTVANTGTSALTVGASGSASYTTLAVRSGTGYNSTIIFESQKIAGGDNKYAYLIQRGQTGNNFNGHIIVNVATGNGTYLDVAYFNPAGVTITGAITTNAITTGSNVTAGTITGDWTLTAGSKLNATYADLAEYYEADAAYEPGTVLEFGGDKEVTIAEDSTIKVAGVVSTNPAYIMNSLCLGTHTVAIALQGRVPTKVRGKIRKGDMLISGGNGFARPAKTSPMMGTVIGKALENFDGEGVIEVAISRM